jgi:hypothetical protein
MHWLEIIHLRPTETKSPALAQLATMQPDIEAAPGLADARIYTQMGCGADVAIHLAWNAAHPASRTNLGLAIAESLRAFGLVDHSLWKEETP